MPTLILRHAQMKSARADLVNHQIQITLTLPLDDETLKLRSKLAYLAVEHESIVVTIESSQLPIFRTPEDDAGAVPPEPAGDGAPGTVTFSANGKSVTLDAETFAESAEHFSDFTKVSAFTADVLNAEPNFAVDVTPVAGNGQAEPEGTDAVEQVLAREARRKTKWEKKVDRAARRGDAIVRLARPQLKAAARSKANGKRK